MNVRRLKRSEPASPPPLDPVTHFEKLLAEDLHDSVCQSLAGTALLVNVLCRQAEAGQPIHADDLGKVAAYLDRTMDDLRALISPDSLAGTGLDAGLRKFAREMSQNVPCRVTTVAGTDVQDPRAAMVLYRLARWAVRHAMKSADFVAIELDRAGEFITMKVHDGSTAVFVDLPEDDFAFLRHYARTAGIAVSLDPLGRVLRARLADARGSSLAA